MEPGPLDIIFPPHGLPGTGSYNIVPPAYTDGDPVQPQYDSSGNQRTSLATLIAGEDQTINRILVRSPSSYVNLTASALVKTGPGILKAIVINSHTTGTLKLWDNTSAAATVMHETISFAVGERIILIPEGQFITGLFATIGGTANLTLYFE